MSPACVSTVLFSPALHFLIVLRTEYIELDPLLKKVQRKRLLREAAFKRRNEMILRLLEQYTGVAYALYRSRVVCGELLPIDRSWLVADETRLVAAGIHSRRRAAPEAGAADRNYLLSASLISLAPGTIQTRRMNPW